MSIPKGWKEVRLGDIGQIVGGGTPLTTCSDFWDNGDIVWLTPTEIDHKYITDSKRKITQKGLENSSAKILPINTILISTRATIGEVGIAKVECCTNQGFQSLICGDSVNHEFIYYLIKNEKETLLKLACGTTFLEISPKSLKSIKIKLPPLKEQEKIAEILSSCDEHIKNLKNLKSELEKEKLHLMNELLSGKTRFANFTTPWQEVTLADICEYKNGGAFEKFVVENGKKYLITLDSISIDGKLKKEHKMIDNVECECLKKNDIVMILSDVAHGYFLGLTGIIPCDDLYVLNQRVGLLRPSENIDAYFLSSYINNNQHYFKIQGQGSSQQNLAKGSIINFKIKLPSLEEQKKIGEVLSACDERLECLNELITAQTTLKSHLLTELLSGNIRVF